MFQSKFKFENRRRVIAALLLAGVSPAAFAGEKAKEEKADKDKDDIVTCGKEIVGNWLIEYDASTWRVMSDTTEVEWMISTTMDKVVTEGFFIEANLQRRTAGGYVYQDETRVWYNVPEIELTSSHNKPYAVFGKTMGHSYHRTVGFGPRRYWVDKNEFWYPAEGKFNSKMELEKPKIAKAFIASMLTKHTPLRFELYVPNWSDQNAIAIGNMVDQKGLEEAVKIASERTKALAKEGMECSIPDEPDFLPPEKEGCFLTTATVGAIGLADDCWELKTLRKFRDDVLKPTFKGRSLVENYYSIAPDIVRIINTRPDAARIWRRTWALGVLPAAIAAHIGWNKAAQSMYKHMTSRLQKIAATTV
ncbi:CFI-box-CTERM domain-containing protein [Hirschia litorea]|uniref:CFI-box-CTERM domain-containing protein n=1 Tax=Hirschia litorea TaxID=1199156 RepID=A0ABW2ILF7_9PROT